MAIVVREKRAWEPPPGFDGVKTIQILAYYLRRAAAPQDKMKLVKLVYLADRESFARRGRPMNFEQHYSMKDGPVASAALDGINGALQGGGWRALSLADNNRSVSLVRDVGEDHLSRSDLAILGEIWERFGHLTAAQIRAWTHENCPEYTGVDAGRIPISYAEILDAVGINNAASRAKELRTLQMEMGRLAKARAA